MFYCVDDLKDNEIFLRLVETREAIPEKHYVPAYIFDICLNNGTKIGELYLRIGHNKLVYYGGNIGYEIFKEYRGHNYAGKACKIAYKQAKKHNMDYLIITCKPENIASSKTCLYAGCEYIETLDIPKDIEMYGQGYRTVMVYKINF